VKSEEKHKPFVKDLDVGKCISYLFFYKGF